MHRAQREERSREEEKVGAGDGGIWGKKACTSALLSLFKYAWGDSASLHGFMVWSFQYAAADEQMQLGFQNILPLEKQ